MKTLEEKVDSILEQDSPVRHFRGMRMWIDDAEKAYMAGNSKLSYQILNNLKRELDGSIKKLKQKEKEEEKEEKEHKQREKEQKSFDKRQWFSSPGRGVPVAPIPKKR